MKIQRAYNLTIAILTMVSCNGKVDDGNTLKNPCPKDSLAPIYALFSRSDFLGQAIDINDSSFVLSANDSLVGRLIADSASRRMFEILSQNMRLERRVNSYFFVDSLTIQNDTALVKIYQKKVTFDTLSFKDSSSLKMVNRIIIDTLDEGILVYSPKSVFSYEASFAFIDCGWKFLSKRVSEN